MLGLFIKSSLVPLTFLAFVLGCSAPVPAPSYKKGSADAGKKPAQTGDDSQDGGENPVDDDDDTVDDGTDGGDDDPMDPIDPIDDGEDPIDEEKPTEPTPAEHFASLDGFRWEMPCERMDGNELCFSNVKVDMMKTMGGKSEDLFEVELKFRGVVEPMKYKDGQREGDRFYIGGLPNDGTYNIYAIEVSSPKQVYYLNWAQNTGHDTFAIDYSAKIKMNGGASVRLLGDGQNDKMIANFKNAMAPGIDKLPDGNKGQFVQMNVLGVSLSP